jgi:hypothetical protein
MSLVPDYGSDSEDENEGEVSEDDNTSDSSDETNEKKQEIPNTEK